MSFRCDICRAKLIVNIELASAECPKFCSTCFKNVNRFFEKNAKVVIIAEKENKE